MNWQAEVENRKQDLITKTQKLLQFESILDEETATEQAPFGIGIHKTLNWLLETAEADGFTVKNVDGYAGHIEFGEGEDIVGVLCHIDVVPAGEGWETPPFSADIRNNRIYARGAMDDKGPTMAAYFALKIVKDLALPLSKRIRIIIGTDEESNWRCVDHYFKKEEMPAIGFAPDADFPIIHAEKGIIDCDFSFEVQHCESESLAVVEHFSSGQRYNMVPDLATVTISGNVENIVGEFAAFLQQSGLIGSSEQSNGHVTLTLKGKAAHAMEPNNGLNAGIQLARFIHTLQLDDPSASFFSFIHDYFVDDTRGEKLAIAYADDISGPLTVNLGKISYSENGGLLGVNIRYPVTADGDFIKHTLTKASENTPFHLAAFSAMPPHHVEKDHSLIQTLQQVYTEQTGMAADLLAIGGGTYARALHAGVAFGPLFPGREDVAHQKDEYFEIDDLLKATSLYAQALFELAK
ncbi:dipeptidase PepV [Bacillus sp. HMF5848]|uniref:dipeptidase PepV n=1 Tax=Bacillus sp. HMF5848 TaxID=2495421 RepID=UPI0021ADF282|nr:dipeptidase PepV [Bacillus sp. HMF5848]